MHTRPCTKPRRASAVEQHRGALMRALCGTAPSTPLQVAGACLCMQARCVFSWSARLPSSCTSRTSICPSLSTCAQERQVRTPVLLAACHREPTVWQLLSCVVPMHGRPWDAAGWQCVGGREQAHLRLHEHKVQLLPVNFCRQLVCHVLQDVLQVPCESMGALPFKKLRCGKTPPGC